MSVTRSIAQLIGALACTAACCATTPAAELERVRVAADGRGFELAPSGQPFRVWGVNYDHDESGRLIEDYWDAEWPKVSADFAEIKALGANTVRIHLQLGRFMRTADEPHPQALAQLKRLLALAETTGLYLDLTGLGCYHLRDVPPWYDALDEPARWAVHARFWQAVAKTCAASPAIFCYDLMNEPTVPGNTPPGGWLGPAFAGKHFVQFITRDLHARERPEVARAWIEQLCDTIRREDPQHLITVGLVDWSLDRPGLTSGFVPEKIADRLDFLAVHVYPQSGKLDEAVATIRAFAAAGKPLIVEETFPLKCGTSDLKQVMRDTRGDVSGWIGFYWGRTAEECRKQNTIADAMTAAWLDLFQAGPP